MDVAARHHLAVIAGPDVGWVAPLSADTLVVGRGRAADLVLNDPLLSRQHLRVRDRGGRVRLADLRSANGSRVRRARGREETPSRRLRRAQRAGTRWREVPVGTRIVAGGSVLEVRNHPGMVLAPDPDTGSSIGEGLLGRLMLPLIMSMAMVPMLLGGGGGRWRLVLMIALPVVLVAAILWPALRQRARQLRQGGDPEEDRQRRIPQPLADPAALLAGAGMPAEIPEDGPRWEVGDANQRAPTPRQPGSRLRGRARLRAERMRFLPVPEPGSGIALVGEAAAVGALARWLAARHAVLTGEQVLAPWPEFAALAGDQAESAEGADGGTLHVWAARPGQGEPSRAERAAARHLVLAPAMSAVPRWCSAVIEVRSSHNRQVSAEWTAAVLAELVHQRSHALTLPRSVHLAELLELDDESGASTSVSIPPGWADPGIRAPIGRGDDAPVWLDLAEHGPHALVAGTTGAGKSELLLAWILGMAHHAAPADVSFVLFDYKGGATFAPLQALAHVVGVLTDLDDATTARALASLQAELQARERALAEVGAHDLTEQRRRAAPGQRLGRLVVVVDEFRVMADTHPEQLDALVRLAAQGRSLGIHLVLATQRPGGAITPDMRANLTVRLCLRVVEETDSLDMLGDTRAATLPRLPGRAVLRTEETQVIQTAWCGPADQGWVNRRVAALNRAADSFAEHDPGRRTVHRPWAPPLPELCLAEELARTTGADPARGRYLLPWAQVDLPEQQRLGTQTFTGGSLLITGGPGSGRSTAARTLVESALRMGTEVHVIAEDAEAWPGADAPAAGTWCSPDDPRRVRRLLQLLLTRARPGLLVLDDADTIAAGLDELGVPGEGVDLLLSLLRRARRLGLDVLVTAEENSRRWAIADQQLLLCPREPADAVMAGAPRELVGSSWPPGRGILLERAGAWVVQVATVEASRTRWKEPDAPPLRLARLPDLVRLSAAGVAEEAELDGPDGPVSSEGPVSSDGSAAVLLGRGGDDAGWLQRRLHPGDTWLVCGPPGSGRTTAIAAISAQAAAQGWRLVHPTDLPAPNADGSPVNRAGQPAAGGRPRLLVLDDADRLSAAAAEACGGLAADGELAVLGAARSEALVSTYQPITARLREATVTVVLAETRPAHLPGVDLRVLQDPMPSPGRGVLIDSRSTVPLQVAHPEVPLNTR